MAADQAAEPADPDPQRTLPPPARAERIRPPARPGVEDPPERDYVELSAQVSGNLVLVAREARPGEDVPRRDLIVRKVDSNERRYVRLSAGDRVAGFLPRVPETGRSC